MDDQPEGPKGGKEGRGGERLPGPDDAPKGEGGKAQLRPRQGEGKAELGEQTEPRH
ncbi:MAG: hypothetical protein LC624_05635 [Halobacteriales archaeon]|nr:hypothetical protein [Halobacteriales archaeon]